MALTPQDIVRREFREAFRGYNQADVDLFLDEVVDEYSRLHEENQKMKVRLAALGQELARFREGRPGMPTPREDARLDTEVRSRVRRFLEDLMRQIDTAGTVPDRPVRESADPEPRSAPPARKDEQREPFWAGE